MLPTVFTAMLRWSRARLVTAGCFAAGLVVAQAQPTELINPFGEDVIAPVTADSGDADLDALVFSGVAAIVDQRQFNFTDPRTRKNFWVTMHGTENGFTVVSYDEQTEQVVVRRGARTRPISLQKAKLVAASAAPVHRPNIMPPAPITTAAAANPPRPTGPGVDEIKNPKTPEEVKQAEYEARMLVSDLLDISMQERARQKALREAQARGQSTGSTTR